MDGTNSNSQPLLELEHTHVNIARNTPFLRLKLVGGSVKEERSCWQEGRATFTFLRRQWQEPRASLATSQLGHPSGEPVTVPVAGGSLLE